jgi:molecular chaperone GrpE
VSDRLPAPIPSPDELVRLDAAIHDLERTVSLEELARGGRRRFRVVSRRALLRELLTVVETFLDARRRQLEAELAEVVERRETEAHEDGSRRVLASLADLADLVDGLVRTLAGTGGETAGRALDRRIDALFRTHGYERIPTVGRPFDSAIHEAVDEDRDPDVAEGVVLREVSRGYRSDGFVLRVARVVVNTGEGG